MPIPLMSRAHRVSRTKSKIAAILAVVMLSPLVVYAAMGVSSNAQALRTDARSVSVQGRGAGGVAVFPKSCTQFAAFQDLFVDQLVLEHSHRSKVVDHAVSKHLEFVRVFPRNECHG